MMSDSERRAVLGNDLQRFGGPPDRPHDVARIGQRPGERRRDDAVVLNQQDQRHGVHHRGR
jgi:hypothetical protein